LFLYYSIDINNAGRRPVVHSDDDSSFTSPRAISKYYLTC